MIKRAFFILGFAFWMAGSVPVFAQESLSVTVTPPLFQLTIGPGESWSSSVKVVNNNAYDVSYAPQVVDFEAQGETGIGKFVPLIESFANEPVQTGSLGSWIEVSKDPIFVKAGSSGDIPFTVRVPENADPGGHYAAIMIGPYEGENAAKGSNMKINSFVTSLLFVRIKGEIIESGRIREFSSEKALYQVPEANFTLRFENTGNTHLQPKGSITLYNMWGKERGQVQINENSNFGNVLPRSIRKYEFSWTGEKSLFDIGRYSAIVTLAYGDEGKQNASATAYFWVIPVVPALITLGIVLATGLILMWFIRRYIRRALALERMYHGVTEHPDVPDRHTQEPMRQISTLRALVQPLKEGVVDLRSVRSGGEVVALETPTYVAPLTIGGFLRKYSLFFVFLIVLIGIIGGLWLYFGTVLSPHRTFEIKELPQGTESATSTR
jgi:hypothetical protein